jgi:hypothetical protein
VADLTIPVVNLPTIQGIQGTTATKMSVPLGGKLITSSDPITIGKSNFRSLINMRYGDAAPTTIMGMSKINTNKIDNTYYRMRNGFHFNKPSETHIMVQSYNVGLTASKVYENKTAPPAAGEFEATALWTDTAGAGVGRFSDGPAGMMAYCNGVDTCIWGGTESDVAAFINLDLAGTFLYDFTDQLTNTKEDSLNIALLRKVVNDATVYVGSTRPLKGVKFYMKVANATAATVAVNTWGAAGWVAVTGLLDGTSVGGTKTLGQTGTISFTSTVGTSRLMYYEGYLLYFYSFTFTGIDATTSLYYCTLDAPVQQIIDYWDGTERTVDQFFKFTTTYTDYTLNVYDDTYLTTDATSYADLSSLGAFSTPNNCVIVGFYNRAAAFNISVPSDRTNSTAATTMAIDYWNGTAFATIGTITDGTSEGAISLAKSGIVSFSPPSHDLIFKSVIANNATPLFYYRIKWDKALAASTGIYYISAIPDQELIRGYKFPVYSQDRLMLCCNMDGRRNSMLVSSQDTAQVFNGDDSFMFEFGGREELTCGCSVFAMYGSNLYTITLVFKDQELWGLVNTGTEWRRYKVADKGCSAPLSLDVVAVPSTTDVQQNQNRNYAVWCTSDGVYISDGRHPVNVSNDIRDLFDQNSSVHINLDLIKSFSGRVDQSLMEYHLWVAIGGSLDTELVLDLRRWKWFFVDRDLTFQGGLNVTSAQGNSYFYGITDTGYLERTEYGTTFDTVPIVSLLHTGDFSLIEGDFLMETAITAIVPAMSEGADPVTMTHYTDTALVGTDYTIDSTKAGYRIAFPVTIVNEAPGILHSLSMTGGIFSPIVIGVYYNAIREHDYV